ncbi:MAG: zinc ABC transporter substrate-binding protein [Pseudomonadota bacterium]
MLARFFVFIVIILSSAQIARAAPRVVTDIAPVHSLVAQVMDGVGAPSLTLPPGVSPHGYAMRPSEAAVIQDADVIFWIGDALTPWLARSLNTLAPKATVVALSEADGMRHLPVRSDEAFGSHDHDHRHDDDGHDDDGHDGDHGHDKHTDDEHNHDEHAHAKDHNAEHYGDIDPHVWLDPANARAMVAAITATLAGADPDNAVRYRSNAKAAADRLTALETEIEGLLGPVRDQPFFVFHDAYQYFEDRFGVTALGAVKLSDASDPGVRKVQAVRDDLTADAAACIFAEPQFDRKLIDSLRDGLAVKVGILDPLGAGLPVGATLHEAMMRNMAQSFAECLR